MLLTTILFVSFAALLVWGHLRRHAAARAEADQACARCGARMPQGASICPKCRVPQQVFELARTKAVEPAAESPGAPRGREHALVRADVCVGCGTCVAACPVPGAITLRGKLAVIDTALCDAHGECAKACPTGAIVMSTGAAVHRVEVPELDLDFQSSVPGLYVVGELGGRGLMKNAINEGKVAVEHVTRVLGRSGERAAAAGVHDVVIVGSGPAGLSAALEAQRAGLDYVVLEQGTLADTVRKYPRHKLLLAEPLQLPLYGDLWIGDASKETLLAVWESIVTKHRLNIQTGERVVDIRREGALLVVDTGSALRHTRKVVLAMGRRGSPRRLGVPGEELGKVFYDVTEMSAFAGRRVLVVGGGDSAIESVLGLANQVGTRVTLSYRGDGFARIKDRNRERLEQVVRKGLAEVLLKSEVREITRAAVELDVAGQPRTLPNDDVIIRIGGDPPYPFLARIGVRMVTKDIPLRQENTVA